MTDMPHAITVGLVLRMLREALEGSPGPWTYFSDRGPGTGMLGTIGGLSAAEVSQQGGPSQTTIAGHVHHVCSSLALATGEIRGEGSSHDRSHTWTVSVVDDAAWSALRGRVRREYEALGRAVQTRAAWDENSLGAAIGAIAHAAYHLGAIRQRVTTPAGVA